MGEEKLDRIIRKYKNTKFWAYLLIIIIVGICLLFGFGYLLGLYSIDLTGKELLYFLLAILFLVVILKSSIDMYFDLLFLISIIEKNSASRLTKEKRR